MNIPAQVSGRPITSRGVHLQPFGYHEQLIAESHYWLPLLVEMGISWVVTLSASDALYKSGAAKILLEAGIIPIVRFSYKFPERFAHMAATEQLVNLYAQYGAPCVIQFANEPFDSREWVGGKVPGEPEAWAIIRDRWNEAANLITERGAIAGFPDGPCYRSNPFMAVGDPAGHWREGRAVYLGHHYGKGRPVNYPEDDVSRYGTPLTLEQYRADLDIYADDPAWNEGEAVLASMNQQRVAWASPNKTPLQDDTCWRGWEKVLYWSREAFDGYEVQIGMTEGGWVPRDRAGSNPVDIRWPYTTPRKVAEKTLQMYNWDSPLFAICPWLLACSLLGGSGWEFDAWVSGAYRPAYDLELPVIQALKDNPPMPPDPVKEKIERAILRIGEARKALLDITW